MVGLCMMHAFIVCVKLLACGELDGLSLHQL